MGYTHYWTFSKQADIADYSTKMATASAKIKEAYEIVKGDFIHYDLIDNCYEWGLEWDDLELKLASDTCYDKPKFTDEQIIFNGVTPKMGCESFIIETKHHKTWDFCKTYGRPYDIMVCAALLILKNVFGDDFSFESDGNIEQGECGWKLAKEIANMVK